MLLNSSAEYQNKPAIFVDRDGVLIEDMHYINSPSDVRLCDGSKALFEMAETEKIPVIIVTNQSGISRGLLAWDDYNQVTTELLRLIGPTKSLAGIYANSFLDGEEDNSWRKPGAGMLIDSAKDLHIDLSRSLMIGDRLSDLIAGSLAGVKTVIHVLTGYGRTHQNDVLMRVENNVFHYQESKARFRQVASLRQIAPLISDLVKSEES